MDSATVTPAVLEWAARVRPGARVADCTVRPMAGGAVADRVDQVTLHLTGGHGALDLVRKEVPALEIAALRAAQAARPEATAIPELVAWGADWLMTALAPGSPPDRDGAMPDNLSTHSAGWPNIRAGSRSRRDTAGIRPRRSSPPPPWHDPTYTAIPDGAVAGKLSECHLDK